MYHNNNFQYKKKYLKHKNKYIKRQHGGGEDEKKVNNWIISDYEWISQEIVDNVLKGKYDTPIAELNILKDDGNDIMREDAAKTFYKNLSLLHSFGANIIKNSVDAFALQPIKPNSMLLWGSPHWCPSGLSNEYKEECYKPENIEYTIYKNGTKLSINETYSDGLSERVLKRFKYKTHKEYKGGIFHYLLHKYPNIVIAIPFCDEIPELFYDKNYVTTGEIYYINVDVGDYTPSASHFMDNRCDWRDIKALIYIPQDNHLNKKNYIYEGKVLKWMQNDNKWEYTEANGDRFNLLELIKDMSNQDGNIMFLGEHVCTFSAAALQYRITAQ